MWRWIPGSQPTIAIPSKSSHDAISHQVKQRIMYCKSILLRRSYYRNTIETCMNIANRMKQATLELWFFWAPTQRFSNAGGTLAKVSNAWDFSDFGPVISDIFTCWAQLLRLVAAGDFHTCAITGDGKLHCFGCNAHGQCDVPKHLEHFVESQLLWCVWDGPGGMCRFISIASCESDGRLWRLKTLRSVCDRWSENDETEISLPVPRCMIPNIPESWSALVFIFSIV